MIEFHLDRSAGIPTYVQLIGQVKQALRLGLLQVGDQLPTAQEVVAALAVNPNTVLKAYRELEHEGLVSPRPGVGTFVARSLAHPALGDPRLRQELQTWVRKGQAAGLDREDLDAVFASVLEAAFTEGVA